MTSQPGRSGEQAAFRSKITICREVDLTELGSGDRARPNDGQAEKTSMRRQGRPDAPVRNVKPSAQAGDRPKTIEEVSKVNSKLPRRWKNCPKQGEYVSGIFVPFKTPLDDRYSKKLQQTELFTPKMVLDRHKSNGVNDIGLWIDLTQVERFYDKSLVTKEGVRYVKIKINGHFAPPSSKQTRSFIRECNQFITKRPDSLIAVHCTRGFNRTGFLICAFLIERFELPVETALSMFAEARSPGIYKGDYIRELFRRYGDVNEAPSAPKKPRWDKGGGSRGKKKNKSKKKNEKVGDEKEDEANKGNEEEINEQYEDSDVDSECDLGEFYDDFVLAGRK